MIPILSSLIVGQGKTLSQRRAFLLSLVYVLAMAVTYTVAGVLAALLGQNIQALFQNPWILTIFSVLFVVLALSMFGYYDLQLPNRWRGHLIELSNRQTGGNYWGVAVMGLLSALIVSPCVTPPLIGVMTVITATGSDAVLGGTALFALSLGMGAPLLVIGTSAGRLLPKVGHWMDRTKAVFGVLLLAVAIWLLERILPEEISMLLWATLLIVSAIYMGALQPLAHGMPAWRTLIKGLGVVLLIYGILLLVGVASGSKDTLQPLRGVSLVSPGLATQTPSLFKRIKTVADMDRALTQANGRPVMLDFYADWCSACKELEKYTFNDPSVQALLSKIVTLRADVTANDTADQALLRHFGVIGPPAILFFGTDHSELKAHRIVGYMPPERFTDHIRSILLQ
jgi:thiol:disulfide interchange protein DsbD